jgi:hypothetical protein
MAMLHASTHQPYTTSYRQIALILNLDSNAEAFVEMVKLEKLLNALDTFAPDAKSTKVLLSLLKNIVSTGKE